MTNSNVRFFSEFIANKNEDNVQKLFSLTHLFYLIIGLLNSVILFGISFYVDSLFKVTPQQAITLRYLLWILALNATFSWISACFDQFLQANELIVWIKKRSTFLKLMQFVILIATIIFKFSIEFYFFAYIFLITVILPLTIIKVKKINPELKMNLDFDKEMFKTIFPYAISIFSFSIFQFMSLNFRPLFLGNISGLGAVADFNIMNTIAGIVLVLSGSFMQVLLPIVTKMALNSDQISINTIVNDGTKYVTILLSSIIFLLILTINETFTLYVGKQYVYLSKWMILWLLTLLLNHRNVMTSLVFTEKNLKSVAIMGAITMTLTIIAYTIFVPKYGVGGVVIGFTIHELAHTLFYYFYFLPLKLQIDTKKVFFNSVLPVWLVLGGACALLALLSSFMHCSVWLSAILKVCIMGLLIIALIWFVLMNKKDKHFVLSFVGYNSN